MAARLSPSSAGKAARCSHEVGTVVSLSISMQIFSTMVDRIGLEIGKQTGRNVELRSNVDPDILGGIVLRVGNSILDASIRNRLDSLRKQVAQA